MTRPLPDVLTDNRAWNAATNEVIEAARALAHTVQRRAVKDESRLVRAVAAMEKLEQEAAKRIEIERAQQATNAYSRGVQ